MPSKRQRLVFYLIALTALVQSGCILDGNKNRQREAIKRVLYDPESATFRDEIKSSKSQRVWCGHVNAKNRFGGMVGYRRYIVTIAEEKLPKDFDQIELEPTDSGSAELRQTFDGIWSVMCF